MRRARQRGVAVVTALLVTALAVTLVCDLFWRQQVLARGMEGRRLHLEARLAMRGMMDDARLALRDAAAVQGSVTVLDGGWDAPRSQARPGAGMLSRAIVDAQSRFNLRNLGAGGAVNTYQLAAFARLLATVRLDPDLARPIAQAVARAVAPDDIDDLLAVPGVTPSTLAQLRDYITLLPEPTAVNVNTAPPEVLTAVANLSLSEARVLAEQRRRAHFRDNGDFALRLNDRETLEGVDYHVSSNYFLVSGIVRLEQVRLETQALIRRQGKDRAALLWMRQR